MNWLQGKFNGKAATTAARPLARSEECVVEYVGDEVLIYDQRTKEAHCLGEAAARVWQASDGETSVAALATELDLDLDTVKLAVEELGSCGLLETSPTTGATRREVTARMVKVGATVAAAPLIYSIAAPTPALAASEAFCLKICPSGCGACNAAGCCCCSPGGGNLKICSIDCSHCMTDVANHSHCGQNITSVSCSSGC